MTDYCKIYTLRFLVTTPHILFFLYDLITPLDLIKQFYYSWKEIILISILKWLWVKFIIYGSILYIKPISITIRSLPNILLPHTWFAYLLGIIVFRGQHTWFAY